MVCLLFSGHIPSFSTLGVASRISRVLVFVGPTEHSVVTVCHVTRFRLLCVDLQHSPSPSVLSGLGENLLMKALELLWGEWLVAL